MEIFQNSVPPRIIAFSTWEQTFNFLKQGAVEPTSEVQ